ncbi:hypothetical protein LCGC14_1429040 [marine sediment metagenome]|uniref:Uncharacterized protein n=1 Tax=marine sediment metagenome TaxID=412755 RepID=A0A0F9JPF6_9ZZZZ
MSSNNGMWLMFFEGKYHVWYCQCADNEPKRPDVLNNWYAKFDNKLNAESYAHDLIKEFSESGVMIEYGIMEVGSFRKVEIPKML